MVSLIGVMEPTLLYDRRKWDYNRRMLSRVQSVLKNALRRGRGVGGGKEPVMMKSEEDVVL